MTYFCMICRSDIDFESTHANANLSEFLNKKWEFQVPVLNVEPPKTIQFSPSFIRNQIQQKVNRNSTVFYVGMALLGGAILALGFVVYTKQQTGNNNGGGNGFNLVPLIVIFSLELYYAMTIRMTYLYSQVCGQFWRSLKLEMLLLMELL